MSEISAKWADRVKQVSIRRLYRSARIGIYDEDVLQDVGYALFARCVDIAAVADAFGRGKVHVPCPKCKTRVQRRVDPLYGLEGHGEGSGWFECPHCGKRLLWSECRKSLREKPRCFDCRTILRGANPLRCSCGKEWGPKAYHRSVGARVRLPCPACHTVIRKPDQIQRKPDRATADEQMRCPKCQGVAVHVAGQIRCDTCGFRRRWREYRKVLKRRDERLECPDCGQIFTWQTWRKEARSLTTGNPQPARDFAESWPKCKTAKARMMQIDSLLQTLHGQGPLAPLFIEGDQRSIRILLDELASQV